MVADGFIAQWLSVHPPTDSKAASSAVERLKASQMPSTKFESFRFTDLKPLIKQTLVPKSELDPAVIEAAVSNVSIADAKVCTAVMVDGTYRPDLSDLDSLPQGVYVGELAGAPQDVQQKLGSQAEERGGVFVQMNSATSSSPLVVHAAEGVLCESSIHIVHVSSSAEQGGCTVASSAQILVHAAPSSRIEVIEEFVAAKEGSGHYFVNAVLEVFVGSEATMRHHLVETEESDAFHVHSTLVEQEGSSTYHLVEARLGGSLTRCASCAASPMHVSSCTGNHACLRCAWTFSSGQAMELHVVGAIA
jgi:Fe-S cluster assembly protein SufD